MIEIKNIRKSFGKLEVLKGLDISMKRGQCIALIGPNGCGKTTLIKCILGMVLAEEGEIIFNNKSIKSGISYRNNIGYMPQIGRYPENMTIRQVMDMIKGIRNSHAALDEELYHKYEMKEMLQKKMRTLSGGTTQKVSAVLAFLFDPQVLILDEPTAGLDPLAAEILKEKIIAEKQKGKLILITSHLLSEMEGLISEVILMQEGKLVLHSNTRSLQEATGQETIASAILQAIKGEWI